MKRYFLVFLVLAGPWACYAQFETPSVPNTVGFEVPLNNASITISIGEPMISTLVAGETVITQGYLQPILKVPCGGTAFTYYPNPAKDHLTIESVDCGGQVVSVQIMDMWGRLLDTVFPGEGNRIALDELSQGMYVFKVFLRGGASGSFNVVKIAN
ncbi:MAG: T9SS type A sorting domain-containing protein [Cyclobacteriaceae bacterium]|nr:T9SS type A sorting domain-containing protein [Cyclobacteriaceae bacterium]MCB9237076.1 T9SS type A sorting domain-containing protein [Flammeovirgaceae bacterium]MCB0500196.1 T9SS type A sorting domain-containing protein [Cyclobacteriaceae bacterium]MCO5271723.1 T9SS type A sorting domain-containing protein [Cyclobacteriaceae bacterium]MCW5901213.1 T9SS type A sorting domain-containing protein [Cyclobacteriaceae bacterium]